MSRNMRNSTIASLAVVGYTDVTNTAARRPTTKGGAMRRFFLLVAVMLAAMATFAGSALASTHGNKHHTRHAHVAYYNGACGGGANLNQMIAGWNAHGVLDQVALMSGQTPGLDGSSERIVRQGVVKVIVVRGGWVTNFTCSGGKFIKLTKKKYIPAGSAYYVPARIAPAPCKRNTVKVGWQGNCGNEQLGSLLVARPCAVKHHKAKPRPKRFAIRIIKQTDVPTSDVFTLKLNGKPFSFTSGQSRVFWFVKRGFPVTITENPMNGWQPLPVRVIRVQPGRTYVITNHKITTASVQTCVLNGVTGVVVNGTCVVNTITQNCTGPNQHVENNVCVNNANQNTNVNNNTVIVNNGGTTSSPPPAPVAPTVSNCTQLQKDGAVLENNSYTIKCDVTGKAGDAVNIAFGAHYGTISGGPFMMTSGSGTYSVTYTAPGEAVTDTVTVTATDTATGASGSSSVSWSVNPHSTSP